MRTILLYLLLPGKHACIVRLWRSVPLEIPPWSRSRTYPPVVLAAGCLWNQLTTEHGTGHEKPMSTTEMHSSLHVHCAIFATTRSTKPMLAIEMPSSLHAHQATPHSPFMMRTYAPPMANSRFPPLQFFGGHGLGAGCFLRPTSSRVRSTNSVGASEPLIWM